ncbi:Pentatricopeptide repeat-containing protein DOT4 [Cardamine amara subsp. amara]|uniref:Pentatricopeptide repeat-containing protein DOT4 n=1 Tax=Cardamine amara subsp. amara TaxID=228776 RepID=A0ABD1BIQ0_CARAN
MTHLAVFCKLDFSNVFSSEFLVERKPQISPGKLYRQFLDIRQISEMSSSVGISFPLAIKLPEVPSCRGSSTVFLPAQVKQKPQEISISSNLPSCLTFSNEVNSVTSLIELLRESADEECLKKAKSIHGAIIKSQFMGKSLTVLLNQMVIAYSKCSDFVSARQVFDEIPQKSIFSWTVLMVGATENGFYYDGIDYFVEMIGCDIVLDEYALSAAIQACIGVDSINVGEMVHAQVITRGFSSLSFVNTSLLNMYAKLGRIGDSCKVFNAMDNRNEVSWNAMISGFVSNGHYSEAYSSFLRMLEEEIRPNVSCFISVSKAIGQLGDVEKGRYITRIALEIGLQSNIHVGTALIDMFAKCGCVTEAWSVFESNFSGCRGNLPWNAMISGYTISGQGEDAMFLFLRMCQYNIERDVYTYCSTLNSIADMRSLEFGKQVHGMVWKSGRESIDVSLCNALMDAYAKCGELEAMRKLFDTREVSNQISWTTLVTAYSQSSEWEEALSVFSQMREMGFHPNQITFSGVLASCASLCFLEYGQQVHSLTYKTGFAKDKCVESVLIDMYAKCGSVRDAVKVFESLKDPDVISWTAMISGYAQHGMAKDALELFRKMELVFPKPNSVTFLCLLFACSHGGLVDDGLRYFHLMEEKYGLVPEIEHYACVVDILGRVGRLTEAWKFIMKMPIEPNEKVWSTLLGACRVHGNIRLAQIAAQKVLSYNPEDSAALVLLSNTYREAGDIEGEWNVRNMMNYSQAMRKEPGLSWITIGGKIHKFCSGDQRHPQKDDIYKKLHELIEKVKDTKR